MVLEPLLWPSGIFWRSSATLAFIGSHRQKRVTAATPNHCLSDLVYSSIKSSNHRYDVIDQTSPIKTQPEIAPKELPRALTHCPKFLPAVTRLYTHHYPISRTFTHHSLLRCHVSPSDVSTHHPSVVSIRWLWPPPLTVVKNFQNGLSCLVFRIDFDFRLRFFIWDL